ncbi:hypothetical protein WA026_016292 [Henosepilachna vigintioctopunctata]|uniref:C3H1-type domain-containing protein n=1 Tax=Henosepilachna vigintioctopunctata TaxID=420089 RepID=A0AAW1UN28_9CUCU
MDSEDSRSSSDNESPIRSPKTTGSRSRSGSRSCSDSNRSDQSSRSSSLNDRRARSASRSDRSGSQSRPQSLKSQPSRIQSPHSHTSNLKSQSNSPSRSLDRNSFSESYDEKSTKTRYEISNDIRRAGSPINNYDRRSSPDIDRPRSPSSGLDQVERCSPRNDGLQSPTSDISSRSSSPDSLPGHKSPGRSSVKSGSSRSSRKSSLDNIHIRSGRSSKASGTSSKISRSSKISEKRKSDDGNSTDSSCSTVESSSRKNISSNADIQPEEISDNFELFHGNSTDSSCSTVESSSRKNISSNADIQPEEISDGDIESDEEKHSETEKHTSKETVKNLAPDINITHEDLSDVSDLEDSIGDHSEDEGEEKLNSPLDQNNPREKDQRIAEVEMQRMSDKTHKNENEEGEEQLDFEAEDGECGEIEEPKKKDDNERDKDGQAEPLEDGEMEAEKEDKCKEEKKKEDLEEGEVSDEDDARPEETEPRPVCRFFSRGQCTWGASCRFLHPGVTDKGNYTMFEMIRPLVPGEFAGPDRFIGRPEPAPAESAWERGLRTAKEMLRKSMKRKEQDIDFEEKKMNLSLAQEEFDKENGYYGRVPSPEPRYVSRHPPVEFPAPTRPPPEEYYNRRQVVYETDLVPPRERVRPYRELPTHKMPDYYNNKYEDESTGKRKPKREVIVQRVEREKERERERDKEERPSRADEWSDPWMRSKSPAGKRSGRKRSYSTGSSYSSSSSTHSTSSRSTYRSRSRSHSRRRGRSRSRKGRHVSPSVIVSERKAANERAAMMNPPAPRKRAPSPGMLRAVTAANPPAPADQFGRNRTKLVAAALARARGRRRSSRSSSESSGSSSSDSDSSGSSSSSSRDGSPPTRRPPGDISLAKAMDALKGNSSEKRQIKLNLKTPLSNRKPELVAELARKVDQAQGKKRPATSPPPGDPKNKKAASRREELLKQLKAVEDAIAKKRSKAN